MRSAGFLLCLGDFPAAARLSLSAPSGKSQITLLESSLHCCISESVLSMEAMHLFLIFAAF